jgi:hypothetical protein
MKTIRAFSILVLLAVAFQAHAAAAPAGGGDEAVAPFVMDGTFLVARLDVDRVDRDAFGKYMQQTIEAAYKQAGMPADELAEMNKEAANGIDTAKQWLADLSEAGGKRLYLMADWANENGRDRGNPMLVVPLADGVDVDKITALLTGEGAGAFAGAKAEQIGKAVVVADEGQLKRVEAHVLLAAGKPVERPDLAPAFAAAGADAPLRIAIVPGEPSRAWLEANMPKLPEPVGGGDVKVLSRGVRYMSIGVTQKPMTTANVTVRCADAENAKALNDVLTKGLAVLKQTAAAGPGGEGAGKEVDTIKPKLQGDAVTFGVDPLLLPVRLRMGFRAEVEVDADVDAAPATKGPGDGKKDDGL